jgi:L-ascorbate metabolism protein UlaG (beta-lactamase superfamily)
VGLREVLSAPVPEQSVVISWVNSYSGIVLRTDRTTLMFDPVRICIDDVSHLDAIVITHEHLDHFEPETVDELHKKTDATVLTTPFIAERLGDLPRRKIGAMAIGDCTRVKDIDICAVYCDHPGNTPLSFFIRTGGISIFHPGDSDAYPEMKSLGEKYAPDLLLYFGTSLENGGQIARLIQPERVVVYDVEPLFLIQRFRENLAAFLPGTGVETIKRYEIYRYTKSLSGAGPGTGSDTG